MADIPLEIYRAYGGKRIMLPVSIKDSSGSLGLVKALLDTGAPNTILFENILKRFRRLKPESLAPPQYSNLGGYQFERKTLGELSIILRDSSDNLVEFKQEIFTSGDTSGRQAATLIDMILGLDFLVDKKAVLSFKDPAKPLLQIE